MKLDDAVLVGVAVLAGLAALAYFVALIVGVIQTGGLLLPALAGFVGIGAVVFIVIRQRLTNAEDDHYEKIER